MAPAVFLTLVLAQSAPAEAADPAQIERIRQALSSAGPAGTPSPYVEVEDGARSAVGAGDATGAAEAVGDRLVLRVAAVGDGYTVDRIEAGRLTPVLDRTYPLVDAAQAMDHVGQGHAQGKTAITV